MLWHNKVIFLKLKNRHTGLSVFILHSLRILLAIHRMFFFMPIVKSRIVRRLKKCGWLTLATLLSGCSLPPAIPVIGAYYPGWLFCMIAGVILVLITRRLMLHKYNVISFAGVIYTALFALYSMLFWLVFF